MNATRTITIVVRGPNDFDVHEGEKYTNLLCWDEMLGQIACMTHPAIGQPRYDLLTPDEQAAKRDRFTRPAAADTTDSEDDLPF